MKPLVLPNAQRTSRAAGPQSSSWLDKLSRRALLAGTSGAMAAAVLPTTAHGQGSREPQTMDTFITRDDVKIFFKDWGPKSGAPVVLSHGWPLSADSWDDQAFHLASQGYRVVAHDRRGHGRSDKPWNGNDMDHYADDLAQLVAHLGLRNISVIGFSAGGGEVARFIGRHGTANVARIALISAVTPFLVKTADNPGGAPIGHFDDMRAQTLADRAEFYRQIASGPFYGFNRPGAKVSQGQIDLWWQQGMAASLKATHDCIAAFSEDFRSDVRKIDRPLLIIHGSDDQIVPIDISARVLSRLLPAATFKVYEGAPHGLGFTHRDRLNDELASFLKS